MNTRPPRGHEELPHTADWALRAWGEDLPALFAEAALGMNALSGVRLQPAPRITRRLELEADDDESLLVAFLSELLYVQEAEGLAFDDLRIQTDGPRLSAEMEGGAVASIARPIKAVTFHNLKIARMAGGFQAEIVFDV